MPKHRAASSTTPEHREASSSMPAANARFRCRLVAPVPLPTLGAADPDLPDLQRIKPSAVFGIDNLDTLRQARGRTRQGLGIVLRRWQFYTIALTAARLTSGSRATAARPAESRPMPRPCHSPGHNALESNP